jgi:hypothetical protein
LLRLSCQRPAQCADPGEGCDRGGKKSASVHCMLRVPVVGRGRTRRPYSAQRSAAMDVSVTATRRSRSWARYRPGLKFRAPPPARAPRGLS